MFEEFELSGSTYVGREEICSEMMIVLLSLHR